MNEPFIIKNAEELADAYRQLDVMLLQGLESKPALAGPARAFAEAIEDYEFITVDFPHREQSLTIVDMLRHKCRQKQLTQKGLAAVLEVSNSHLSAVLRGKRRVTLNLAQKLYHHLNINAEFIFKVI